jgi:arylsulfotransferase ASST
LAENRSKNGRLGGRIKRRTFLGALTAAGIALTGVLDCAPNLRNPASASSDGAGRARAYRTRPDLRPPAIEVNASSPEASSGYIFVAPKKEPGGLAPSQDAPLIIDGKGEPVWFHPLRDPEADAFNFEVQTYKGEAVLTWCVGHHSGYGQGEYVIADRSYNELTRVRAGNGYEGDHHEFLITYEDTALLTVYGEVPMDLSFVGGPVDAMVLDGIAQEVDIESGEVLFEVGPGTLTAWQHDARRHPDGTITIFDNGSAGEEGQSRGIVVEVDEDAMKATLIGDYRHPDKLLAATQGNVQVLPNGNVFVGWGSEPYFSEFSPDGELLFDATLPPAVESYRAYRFPWKGSPQTTPATVAESGVGDEITVYVSWNGATEVAGWQILAGPDPDEFKPIGSAPRTGFETAVTVRSDEPYLAVKAEDGSGNELATSRAVKAQGRDSGRKRAWRPWALKS